MIIYNAEIYSMTEDMHFYGYVEVQDGKITAVEQGKPDAVSEGDILAALEDEYQKNGLTLGRSGAT